MRNSDTLSISPIKQVLRIHCWTLIILLSGCISLQPEPPQPPSAKSERHSSSEIATYIAQLSHSESSIRANAVEQLDRLSPDKLKGFEEEAIPDLITLLQDPDLHIQDSAIEVLRELQAKEAIPALIPLVGKNIPLASRNAVVTLGEMGEAAKAAIPHIIPQLKSPDQYMRGRAVKALGQIGRSTPKTVVPPMLPLLKDPDPYVRYSAIASLAHIGAPAKASVSQLLVMLKKEPKPDVRCEIENALYRIQASGKPCKYFRGRW